MRLFKNVNKTVVDFLQLRNFSQIASREFNFFSIFSVKFFDAIRTFMVLIKKYFENLTLKIFLAPQISKEEP